MGWDESLGEGSDEGLKKNSCGRNEVIDNWREDIH